ncbi:hypothetical protein TrLO_g1965 [Triparma laevis f. longispina]|uniref:Uncharacterized protein n=1 Tax=Triparma laevis f. longispina TaxID=1714387 RepID=A0A9W7ABQ0_9STRA|nr:hypothetical protein TrLO_g1965 [Triparma laevis f. longispina]
MINIPSFCHTPRISEDLAHPLLDQEFNQENIHSNVNLMSGNAKVGEGTKYETTMTTMNYEMSSSSHPSSPKGSAGDTGVDNSWDDEAWTTSSIQSQSQIAMDLVTSGGRGRPASSGRRQVEKLSRLFNKFLGRRGGSMDNMEDRSFEIAEVYARRRQSESQAKEKIGERQATIKENMHSEEMEKATLTAKRRGMLEKIETSRVVLTGEQAERRSEPGGKKGRSPARSGLGLRGERNEEGNQLSLLGSGVET